MRLSFGDRFAKGLAKSVVKQATIKPAEKVAKRFPILYTYGCLTTTLTAPGLFFLIIGGIKGDMVGLILGLSSLTLGIGFTAYARWYFKTHGVPTSED